MLTRKSQKKTVLISNEISQNNIAILKITNCQIKLFEKSIYSNLFQIKEMLSFCTLNEGIKYLFNTFEEIVHLLV